MKSLDPNWFAEGMIDFEYKKYVLLDYLQHVQNTFNEMKLYPPMAELVEHLRTLNTFRKQKQDFLAGIPKRIVDFRPSELRIVYEDMPEIDKLEEIDEIVSYSIPLVRRQIHEGRDIYELVEKELKLEPIGLEPVYKNEGYVLMHTGKSSKTAAYRYGISVFAQGDERMAGIHTRYITSFNYSLGQTFSHMKLQLIRNHNELPNPATYLAHSGLQFPIKETLMPVVKRLLLKNVA